MLTTSALVQDRKTLAFLTDFNKLFSTLERKLFVELYVKKGKLTALKSQFISEYGISARHFNSIAYQLSGRVKSFQEIQKNEIVRLHDVVNRLIKSIRDLDRKIKKNEQLITKINQHKEHIKVWRRGHLKKKRKMPATIRGLQVEHLESDIRKLKFKRHQKLKRFEAQKARYDKKVSDQKQGKIRLSFGSRKRQNQQHHLLKNGFKNHREWLHSWRTHLNKQSFWIGSKDEKNSNQNAQYDPNEKTLRLRVAKALRPQHGDYIVIPNVDFPYQADLLSEVIGKGAVSYRFILEKKSGTNVAYVQASFEEPQVVITSDRKLGAIGVDLNAEHIAMTECDRFGNPVHRFSYPFESVGQSTHQLAAQIGDHIAEITDRAVTTGKPIVCERLDFRAKKRTLRENGGKGYRKMLSAFCYKKFLEQLSSQCRRKGIELIVKNPAYTSVIGFYKFYGYESYSSHELAALAIARRGLGMSERVKSKVGRSGTVSIFAPDQARVFYIENRVRHNWSFWSRNALIIRKAILQWSKKSSDQNIPYNPRRPSGYQIVIRSKCDLRMRRSPPDNGVQCHQEAS